MTKVEAAKVLRAMEKALIETGNDSPLDCMIPLFKEACLMGAEALDPQPTEMIRKLYHKLLLMLGDTPIGRTKWYRHTIYEEAQRTIGNR